MRVAENPSSVMKKRIAVTLSVGVAAETRPGNMKSLLQSADEAL
jgi:PleD family two-component response regulator